MFLLANKDYTTSSQENTIEINVNGHLLKDKKVFIIDTTFLSSSDIDKLWNLCEIGTEIYFDSLKVDNAQFNMKNISLSDNLQILNPENKTLVLSYE